MLTMKTQYSLKNAEGYFREHLRVGDYYMEGQSVSGQWFGQGAMALGLSGITTEKEFLNLCHNLHPQTDEQLTERMNAKRITVDAEGKIHESANRRVFYDFTFSPAKSVSIAALVGNGARIIEAHDEAVMVALRELQTYAASRIRKQNQYAHRLTGNLVGAVFRHDTSRALDPHLHSHCILFNATRDSVDGSWKALEICEMLSAKKFAENVYYHELAGSLNRFGYRVQNNPRGDFEIEGVPKELVKKFSKRHDEIDRKTKELLEREPDKATRNLQEIRANIAHNERARKIKDVGLTKLQSLWHEQMSGAEIASVQSLASSHPIQIVDGTAEQAVNWAEQHLFERRSVVHEHELWRHALEHSRGQNVSLAEIQSGTRKRDYIRDKQFHGKLTTREVLQREMDIVSLAQDGTKIANGELVTVKQIHADGRIALNDGRTLPKNYRQFVRGYAVTSYAAQGKTVDYVLFSDSAVAAATNEQQWYVTISRGRRGVKIFTADKIQLRQNIAHSGNRPLALDMTRESSVHKLATIWGRDVTYVLNIQHSQRKSAEWRVETLRQDEAVGQSQTAKQTESVKPTETVKPTIQKSETTRRRIDIPPHQTNQPSRGMRA
jgi:conjugative relaxase-like TrwC/TraI family protein